MKTHLLELPFSRETIRTLRKGDKILLSGVLYTARDKAHQRFIEILNRGEEISVPLSGSALFYCGPSPAPTGKVCGAIGPTTSARMDVYTPRMLEAGLMVMIGKGEREEDVETEIRKHGAVYLSCPGGVSALLARCIVSCETYLWEDLGAEAVYRIEVRDLPCFVACV